LNPSTFWLSWDPWSLKIFRPFQKRALKKVIDEGIQWGKRVFFSKKQKTWMFYPYNSREQLLGQHYIYFTWMNYAWNRNNLAFWAVERTKCFAFMCKTSTIRKVSHIGSMWTNLTSLGGGCPGTKTKQTNNKLERITYQIHSTTKLQHRKDQIFFHFSLFISWRNLRNCSLKNQCLILFLKQCF